MWWLALLALATGALIPIQAAANAVLSRQINSVVYAALLLFAVGLLTLSGIVLSQRIPPPSMQALSAAPLYSFAGGFIVASYVLAITFLAPRLGVATAISFVVTGQIIAAVVIDHLALLGAAQQLLTPQRTAGVVFMIAGVYLARS